MGELQLKQQVVASVNTPADQSPESVGVSSSDPVTSNPRSTDLLLPGERAVELHPAAPSACLSLLFFHLHPFQLCALPPPAISRPKVAPAFTVPT